MDQVVTQKPLLSAFAIAATLLMLQGCFTPAVYSRWEHSGEIPALTLRLRSAEPSSVKIDWEPETIEIPLPGGTLEFDPELEHCSAVSVIATDGGDMLVLDSGVPRMLPTNGTYMRTIRTEFSTSQGHMKRDSSQEISDQLMHRKRVKSLWMGLDEPECKVLFVVGSVHDPRLSPVVWASTAQGEPTMATIPTRRNPHWLELMPVALLADATIIAPIVATAVCMQKPAENLCLLAAIGVGILWLDYNY
jgi:hypothetical protein